MLHLCLGVSRVTERQQQEVHYVILGSHFTNNNINNKHSLFTITL